MEANEPTPSSGAERWRFVLRRLLPRGVLFVGIALILVHTFRSRPSAMDVVYEYGRADRGLVAAKMVYWQGDEIVHQVRFDYHRTPPPATQAHQLKLHEGDYTVEVSLFFRGTPPNGVGRSAPAPDGENKITVRRPLLVHGGGELHVYVAPRAGE